MSIAHNVRIIPAKPQNVDGKSQRKRLNVAAYCRVSTEQEEQLSGTNRILYQLHQL